MSHIRERQGPGLRQRLILREGPGLRQKLIWGVLHHLSKHGKEIDRTPMSSYRKFEPKPAVRKASNYQPAPLVQSLPRRSSCITPPLMEAREFDQTQSPLFNLPEEILVLIYEQVIGKRVVHIVRRPHTLSHATCKAESSKDQDSCRGLKCRGTKLPNGVCLPEKRNLDSFVSLLQTCRRIYIDAIEVLYTTNTFDFDCMESLISFSTSVLPHRFDSIQNVQLDLRFDQSHYFCEGTPCTDYTRWERTWRIIGSMKSLQHLSCRIIWWRSDITGAEEDRYLSEMLQVGRLKVFEISLPALKWNDPKEKHAEATFDVFRRPMQR